MTSRVADGRWWVATALAVCMAAASLAADDALAGLRHAGEYVRAFETKLSVIVAEEDYLQERVLPKTTDKRRMRSEVLFTWLGREHALLWVRNPLEVDGAAVPDSKDRFDRIAKDDRTDTVARLRALRRESARFNLGDVYRDFNDPTYALLLLDPAVQPRFEFKADGRDRVGGYEAQKHTFVERGRPTIIRNGSADVPAHGVVWIAADGTVVHTRLQLEVFTETMSTATQHVDQVTDVQIDVSYSPNAAMARWLPARMEERYRRSLRKSAGRTFGDLIGADAGSLERIECTAVYKNFRRFETSGRIIEE